MSYQTTVPSRSSQPQARATCDRPIALHDPERLDVGDVVEHQPAMASVFRSVRPVGPGRWPSSLLLGDEGEGDRGS